MTNNEGGTSQTAEPVKLSIGKTQNCIVIPIQAELTMLQAKEVQRMILESLKGLAFKGVVIDLSGVDVIDTALWETFKKTAHMIKILGTSSFITGLQPGVVASLIDLDLNFDDVLFASSVDIALQQLNNVLEIPPTKNQNSEISAAHDSLNALI